MAMAPSEASISNTERGSIDSDATSTAAHPKSLSQGIIIPAESQTTQNNEGASPSDVEKYQSNKSIDYTNPEQRPPVFKSAWHEIITCIVVTFAPAAASMSSSAFQTSLAATSKHFNVFGGKLTWCVSSVMLANGACLLLMGGIADAFGRKRALMFGYSGFAIFSLIGGFMDNFILLCLFRALQGAMVACGTPAAAGFLGSTYKDSRRKNMVMSCFSIGAPVGGASGFFVAGVCIVALSWRSVHYFLSILFATLAINVFIFMPNDNVLDWKHARGIMKGLDYVGAFISLTGFTLICFSLTQVDSTEDRWKTPYIIALLVVGIAFVIGFGVYEFYVPKNPLMPLKMFTTRSFVLCMLIGSFCWMTFFGVLNYYAVFYFEEIRGYSAIITACCFLTQPIAGVLVNIFAGLTMHIIKGHYLMSVGTAGMIVACIIWATMSIDRNYFLGPFWAFIFTVLGVDLIYNVANRCALSSVDRSLQSRAAGTFNTILQLSSSVGLGLSTTILSSKNPYYGTQEQNDHIESLFHDMKYNYYFGIALTGSALCMSLLLKIGVVGATKK